MFDHCLFPPSEEEIRSKEIDKQSKQIYKEFHEALKILLLGPGESGKTTIIKQMRILHDKGFSDDEKHDKIAEIRENIHESIVELITQVNRMNIQFGSPYVAQIAKRVVATKRVGEHTSDSDPHSPRRYVDDIIALWNDEGIQECFRRSNEFQLNDNTKYYLDKIEVIMHPDYIPDSEDILHCRKKTTGIYEIKFQIRKELKFGGGTHEIRMFDVGGQRDQRAKWIQVFDGIQAVLFMMSCSDYDQMLREDTTVNRLSDSLILFADVWHNRFLTAAGVVVFLNKQDIMETKVRSGNTIAKYFPEYTNYELPVSMSEEVDECIRTKHFIKDKLEVITNEPPRIIQPMYMRERIQRRCYYHFTVATDTDNIRRVFKDVHDMILNDNLNSGLLF